MSRKSELVAGLLIASIAAPALACLWDSDTLQMERLRFPGVLEIITGKFVRHSRAYYEWRIGDRQKKLESNRGDPALIDDLAVAYAKLGQPEKGIPLLEEVLKQHPDRYETLSNLGTLLFFAGRLDDSKAYIRRALEINPDAHFGREKYQLLLTEYLQQSDYTTKGVMRREDFRGFDTFLLGAQPLAKHDELKKATTGVLGMMHFADFQSPILLEALGDLLRRGGPREDMTQLAARAYLSAARATKDPSASAEYRQMASQAIHMHLDFPRADGAAVVQLERQLDRELADARTWYDAIEAREKKWIADGREVDREFAQVYYESLDQTLAAAEKQVAREWPQPSWTTRLILRNVFAFSTLLATGYFVFRWIWRWSRSTKLSTTFSPYDANK